MFLEVGDRFQNYIFWRFAEAFMRWACRMAGRAMLVHDNQNFGIGCVAG
jgi:hypothetical protein